MAPRKGRTVRVNAERDSSPELGSGNFGVTVNERTGRPVRLSAGRPSSYFVDTEEALEGLDDDEASDYESDKLHVLHDLPTRGYQQRLRPLEPLPPRVPDFPAPQDVLSALTQSSPSETHDEDAAALDVAPLQLTFNIPLGFSGPLRVEIPRAALSTGKTAGCVEYDRRVSFALTHPVCKPVVSKEHSEAWGWSSLPAEIRNRVYRFLFVQSSAFNFEEPTNFCCSSQFLRTCKQVQSEGREILYSENSFTFERNKSTRAPYWACRTKEIGFTDVRLFLTSIGNRNVSMLRDVTFICDDAMPSTTRDLTNEERRFTYDPNLLECFRILGKHGRLRKIQLGFFGRRTLWKTDDRFLVALRSIQADEVKVIDHPRWKTFDRVTVVPTPSKLSYALKKAIEETLTRKKKLWPA